MYGRTQSWLFPSTEFLTLKFERFFVFNNDCYSHGARPANSVRDPCIVVFCEFANSWSIFPKCQENLTFLGDYFLNLNLWVRWIIFTLVRIKLHLRDNIENMNKLILFGFCWIQTDVWWSRCHQSPIVVRMVEKNGTFDGNHQIVSEKMPQREAWKKIQIEWATYSFCEYYSKKIVEYSISLP